MAAGLTEFECCVLATVREHKLCSAYEVRQLFARSTTPEWSGSTGSVYPAINRLLQRGLIRMAAEVGDRRGRKNLTVTSEGEAAVVSWITDIDPSAAKATPDPIRTRTSFLEQLKSDADRLEFFSHAEALTKEMARQLKAAVEAERGGSRSEYAAGIGALYQLEARLKWLREARKLFEAKPD